MIKQMVIAAGGQSSRIKEDLDLNHNKCFICSQGLPIIYHTIDMAKRAGVDEFFISVDNNKNCGILILAVERGSGDKLTF